MSDQTPKITIGIVSYQDIQYLEKCLPTALNQTYPNYEIIVCDNTPNQETTKWLNQTFQNPKLSVTSNGGNIGFGRAHNHLITKAIQNNSKYYLTLNSDTYLTSNFLETLLQNFIKEDSRNQTPLAALTPKILQWPNFPNSPIQSQYQTLDSTGIIAFKKHHFKERAFSQKDNRPLSKDIWGVSGAASFFCIQALTSIQHSENEFYDNNFFMYKEDVDISYRLRWAGYDIRYCPDSICWHNRTGKNPGNFIQQIKARKTRKQYIKENSYLNDLQLIYKNWSPNYSISTKLKTCLYLIRNQIYFLLFDPKILKQFQKFIQLKPQITKKRQTMPRKISAKQMEQLFH